MQNPELPRCTWCLKDELYMRYHDEEWGIPMQDDRHLFEHLVLETFQAGLSWHTILKRRENFRMAFDNFDPQIISGYDEQKRQALMNDSGIIRNRAKIDATIKNAGLFLKIQKEFGSFYQYLQPFTKGVEKVHRPVQMTDYKAESELSRMISKDLKKRGFSFTGPTGMHAFLQAVGVLDEHMAHCYKAKK